MPAPTICDVPMEYINETALAYQLQDKDGENHWLPKSLIEFSDGVATMPIWLAKEKDIDYK